MGHGFRPWEIEKVGGQVTITPPVNLAAHLETSVEVGGGSGTQWFCWYVADPFRLSGSRG